LTAWLRRSLLWSYTVALSLADRIVPAPQRASWNEEWRGDFWRWMLDSDSISRADGRSALWAHVFAATRVAFVSRLQHEPSREAFRRLIGSPRLCMALCALPLLLVILLSGGLPVTRRLAAGIHYPHADRIMILAQGPPFFGIRLGFGDRETQTFRQGSKTLESLATYSWHSSIFGNRSIQVADVSPEFFSTLEVAPLMGALPAAASSPSAYDSESSAGFASPADAESFVASYDFWQKYLRRGVASPVGQKPEIGQKFEIGGRPMTLAGVLPKDFSFLSAPIAVWTIHPEDPIEFRAPDPRPQWWIRLKGAVARLRPGVPTQGAEKELRQLLVHEGIARRNFSVLATPVMDLVYQSWWSHLSDLGWITAAIVLLVAFNLFRDRRRGIPANSSLRFWAFFIAKTLPPMAALFLFVFEFMGASNLGLTGGVPRGGAGPFSFWLSFLGAGLILFWAWRDQPGRCRVCLRRMYQPIRIGTPGQVLLETNGMEVMCPEGHGSMYHSASVIGSDLSDQWMAFATEFDLPGEPPAGSGPADPGGSPKNPNDNRPLGLL
jgi:hypothetical protein